jgi:hypothetical protein
MAETAKITSKNQTALPANLRKSPGAATGNRFHPPLSGRLSEPLIGAINRRNGCRTTPTYAEAAAKYPQFSELQR